MLRTNALVFTVTVTLFANGLVAHHIHADFDKWRQYTSSPLKEIEGAHINTTPSKYQQA